MNSLRQQVQNHAVALISLVIAVSALAYNTWRNETTEEQRNVRHAAFRVLESLGELQEVVDLRYYYLPYEQGPGQEGDLRIRGFGGLAMTRDLMMLMPEPAPDAGERLHRAWLDGFDALILLDGNGRHAAPAQQAEQDLTSSIERARQAVLEVLKQLD
ncbi:MAG: hypothetical protein KJO33_04100 [Gammaproteobacteria bacterium]|nr:hypothetical protein [Gammaproteobacteria bacterium]